ncbi:MAG: M28 family peptidase [Bacteroidales bacterium]|nr:M28 family peptidase [Bacteroidales bacterium]
MYKNPVPPFYKISFIALFSLILMVSFSTKEKPAVVTAFELKEWIDFLASDEMKGRANGSPEMKIAADWIAEKFRGNGVKPLFQNGSYTRDYTFTSRQRTFQERNVAGIIEGTDPSLKGQYIVISAHFDHVGIGQGAKPDSIRNGADDNASGVCTMIGIARTITLSRMKPGRTLIFAAFSGEEAGMRGSRNFVTDPPVPLKNIYVNINFEMTGHSEYLGKNRYYMTGCSFSDLDDRIAEFTKGTGYQLIDTIPLTDMLFSASDNIAFSRLSVSEGITKGIPSGTFATSALADYLHGVDDEAELFDFENMEGLVSHFSDLIIWLSNNKSDIKWTDPKYSGL